ncbi:type II secretion system protein [Desulfosporosinus nitroreducens]|uniref:Type II secretion system GspH family protein n=1 Tax=Desulfosporosinus nitroreducens TaxID=2018668 RepID=A0ABT8QS17_9FIRM|nr:type II secretion system protein [Desulfosporosinus nitroreducens]MDO0822873.1 type II secretion system GspH family protein [Desulfosporosinus nitroreducens]
MIKRRKDNGFTLIELMIVIAVIGILAVVLVPKFGSIKASAKDTGVTTNFRSVAASVHAVKLSNDVDDSSDVTEAVIDQLEKDFSDNNVLVNPYTKKENIADDEANAAVIVKSSFKSNPNSKPNTDFVGAIVVRTQLIKNIPTVTIYGCDDKGALIEGLEQIIKP